jgi:hypothetical protein
MLSSTIRAARTALRHGAQQSTQWGKAAGRSEAVAACLAAGLGGLTVWSQQEGSASTEAPAVKAPEVITPVFAADAKVKPGRQMARRNSRRKQKRHYPYVIVGAGTTANAAVEAIKNRDPDGQILILSEESVSWHTHAEFLCNSAVLITSLVPPGVAQNG